MTFRRNEKTALRGAVRRHPPSARPTGSPIGSGQTLAWTEAVTTLEHCELPDDVFAQARAELSEQELADLTLAVIAVNGANRLNIAFHNPPVPFTIDVNERVAADSWWVVVLR